MYKQNSPHIFWELCVSDAFLQYIRKTVLKPKTKIKIAYTEFKRKRWFMDYVLWSYIFTFVFTLFSLGFFLVLLVH